MRTVGELIRAIVVEATCISDEEEHALLDHARWWSLTALAKGQPVTHLYEGGEGATRPYPFCGDPGPRTLSQHVAVHFTKDAAMREVVERNQSQATCPNCLRVASVYDLKFRENAEWRA